MQKIRIIFIPGNGGGDINAPDGWFSYLKKQFEKLSTCHSEPIRSEPHGRRLVSESLPHADGKMPKQFDKLSASQVRHDNEICLEVISQNFPDPVYARKDYWLPFLDKLGADENTILIGHSSGAVAAMRYAQEHQILGSVLVAASFTDLGMESEKISGYFNTEWDWQKIKNNQQWVIQYHSTDDPFIPAEEARFIHKKLDSEYFEYTNQEHFGYPTPKLEFPELVEKIRLKLNL